MAERIFSPKPMLECFVVYSSLLDSALMVDVHIRRQIQVDLVSSSMNV